VIARFGDEPLSNPDTVTTPSGDLAVWDGHVAMIVGNGMMIAVVQSRNTHRGPLRELEEGQRCRRRTMCRCV